MLHAIRSYANQRRRNNKGPTMIDPLDLMALENDRDRRSGLDRRLINYDIYLPERRQKIKRRDGIDRRKRTLSSHNPTKNQPSP
jgi:hypothetical protein